MEDHNDKKGVAASGHPFFANHHLVAALKIFRKSISKSYRLFSDFLSDFLMILSPKGDPKIGFRFQVSSLTPQGCRPSVQGSSSGG
jgi:hypothetical protein